MEKMELAETPLPLLSLNHVSFVCKSVSESVKFYEDVLGFLLIKRPSSFKFVDVTSSNKTLNCAHIDGICLLEFEIFPLFFCE